MISYAYMSMFSKPSVRCITLYHYLFYFTRDHFNILIKANDYIITYLCHKCHTHKVMQHVILHFSKSKNIMRFLRNFHILRNTDGCY